MKFNDLISQHQLQESFFYVHQYIELPDEKSKRTFKDAAVLPTVADCEAMRKDFLILVARVLVQHVHSLQVFQDLVPHHIVHKHSKEASSASCLSDILIHFVSVCMRI